MEGLQRSVRSQENRWEIAVAPNGEAAMALLEASCFDVVVTDMRIPGMDGVALLARVREEHPQVVRIALSGSAELAATLRAAPVAHQFLAQPCDAEMLRVAVERACHLQAVLQDESIRRTVGSLSELPSLPRTYQALTLALAEPEVPISKIAQIVELDVGISAKVLQLVNSAFFGIARPVTSIRDAVSFIGVATLKTLVLSVEMFGAFVPPRPIAGFSLEGLQRHARLTSYIAARLPVPKHLSDIAMAAGLLHDVGKLILAWKFPERLQRLLGARNEPTPLYKMEETESGFSHAEMGAYLLGLWGLPYALVEAVALHHAPTRVPSNKFDAPAAVYIANLLAKVPGAARPARDESEWETNRGYLESLGVVNDIPCWQAMAREAAPQLAEL